MWAIILVRVSIRCARKVSHARSLLTRSVPMG